MYRQSLLRQEESRKLVFIGNELDELEEVEEQIFFAKSNHKFGESYFETNVAEERRMHGLK